MSIECARANERIEKKQKKQKKGAVKLSFGDDGE